MTILGAGMIHPKVFLEFGFDPGEVSGIAGVEFPLGDAIGNPTVRGVLGISWSPRFNDMDNDGRTTDDVDADRDGLYES